MSFIFPGRMTRRCVKEVSLGQSGKLGLRQSSNPRHRVHAGLKSDRLLVCGKDGTGDFSETDAQAVPASVAAHDDHIAIGKELALAAVAHCYGSRAFPGYFKHGAEAAFFRARYGARGHEISRVDVASTNGMVGQLLADVPVHVFEVGAAHHVLGIGAGREDADFEIDVKG